MFKARWYTIAERLPETDQYVLLSFSNFSLPIIGRCEKTEQCIAFYAGNEDETLASQDLYVNAWMPLPEPYKDDLKE